MEKTNHPYIVIDSKIRGDNPIILGTGMKVIDIVIEYEYKGYTIDQIIDYHPHLQLKQIHDALSYYYENQFELDQIIKNEQKFAEKKKEELSRNLEANYA